MIAALKIQNFQRHRSLTIRFDPHITVIRGRTDAGKSAVLRALRWLLLNEAPSNLIRDGAAKAIVKVRIDGQTIKRIRSKSQNVYAIGQRKFVSFGATVPEPIAKIIQLNEINFQGQHDSPFWFNESAGEVSRQLNRVIDLSIIDTSLASIATTVRQAQDRKTVSEHRLKEFREQLSALAPQRERAQQFGQLKGLNEKLAQIESDRSGLDGILSRIHTNEAKALRLRAEESATLFRSARQVYQLERRCGTLAAILNTIRASQRFVREVPDFEPVDALYTRWKGLREQLMEMSKFVSRIVYQEDWASELERDAFCLEGELHEKMKGAKCPLCGQKII